MSLTTILDKASPSSFELVFPVVPQGTDLSTNRELSLNIYSTIIPGLTMDVDEERWQGAKFTQATGSLTFEPWNVNFIVDSEFKNWLVFYNWLTYINNNHDKFIEAYDDYVVDATLRVMDNYQSQVFTLFFNNVWINSLGELALSHREGEQLLECNASFVYNRFETRS